MWYSIDFDRLIKILLPPVLNSTIQNKWIQSLLNPLKETHTYFGLFRLDINKRARFNGQVIILENILNDEFDPDERGIIIQSNVNVISQVYIYQPAESGSEYIYQPSENIDTFIFQPDEDMTSSYDFIVIVPDGILSIEDELRIKALTNRWKIDGKRAKFQYQTGQIF